MRVECATVCVEKEGVHVDRRERLISDYSVGRSERTSRKWWGSQVLLSHATMTPGRVGRRARATQRGGCGGQRWTPRGMGSEGQLQEVLGSWMLREVLEPASCPPLSYTLSHLVFTK